MSLWAKTFLGGQIFLRSNFLNFIAMGVCEDGGETEDGLPGQVPDFSQFYFYSKEMEWRYNARGVRDVQAGLRKMVIK